MAYSQNLSKKPKIVHNWSLKSRKIKSKNVGLAKMGEIVTGESA